MSEAGRAAAGGWEGQGKAEGISAGFQGCCPQPHHPRADKGTGRKCNQALGRLLCVFRFIKITEPQEITGIVASNKSDSTQHCWHRSWEQ